MRATGVDPDDAERQCEQTVAREGLTKDITDLVCAAYAEQQIEEDDVQTWECFESAFEECHREEESDAQQQIFDQEKEIEEQKHKLEGQYQRKFADLRDHEKKKILAMKKQYADIDHAVKVRADNLKLLKIENKKQQEYHDQQIRELKELARRNNVHPGDQTSSASASSTADPISDGEVERLRAALEAKQEEMHRTI